MAEENRFSGTSGGFKNRVWTPILRPVVALTVICLVTSLLLGLTNDITKPLIEKNNRIAAEASRRELLPEADAFEEVALDKTYENVTSMYKAANGAGYIVQASAKGYGGQVPVMVAFDPSGQIAGVKFLENNETPGLGQKVRTDAWFSKQYMGLPAEPFSAKDGKVDKIASATITSNAANAAVNAAIAVYSGVVWGRTVDTVATASKGGKGGSAKEAKTDGR